ncbi:MAG: sugar ABC transporter permease [Clostridia bacterium]|nr:sugar ABC transporter permease [Clostridia bacterium]
MRKFKPSNKTNKYLLALPILLIYGLFLGGGLIGVAIESSGYIPALGLTEVGMAHYMNILSAPNFWSDLTYSLYIAFFAATISTLLGVYMAYRLLLSKHKKIEILVKKIMQMGMILPYLYMVFLVLILFSRTGLISRVMYNLGFIETLEQFPQLFYTPSGAGIILIFVMKGVPFVTLFVLNIMGRIGKYYYQVAKIHGASDFYILKKIYLPLSSTAIIWSSSIVFIYYLGAFEVPYLLNSNKNVNLSSRLYSLYIDTNISTIPDAMAYNMLLVIIGIIAVVVYSQVLKRIVKGGGH